MTPLDLFSDVAQGYARFRPRYPAALYETLLSHCIHRQSAWDVGTGNGQVAVALSAYFEQVYATDISGEQLAQSASSARVRYSIGSAEHSGLPAHSIDLITVGQALHWFDLDAFFREVLRVAKQPCILAAWGYGLVQVQPELDQYIRYLYSEVLGAYWDSRIGMIDDHYRQITFPCREIQSQSFDLINNWSVHDLLGFFQTWSATNAYFRRHGRDPVQEIEEVLIRKAGNQRLACRMPVFLKMWVVNE